LLFNFEQSILMASLKVQKVKMHAAPALYSVDLGGCTDLVDRAPDEIMSTFCAALRRAGATVVHEICHSFPETGLTCVLILSESHAVLHTWPETGTVNIDIFSCSKRLNSLAAIDELRRSFGAQHAAVQEIPRADGYARPAEERR
jgi:S-adenosylmethionine decarboxylase